MPRSVKSAETCSRLTLRRLQLRALKVCLFCVSHARKFAGPTCNDTLKQLKNIIRRMAYTTRITAQVYSLTLNRDLSDEELYDGIRDFVTQ
jgi:hypothetical protein